MALPNFLYLGAPRAGSKWMYWMLRQHPDCYVPNIPDPFFFDRDEVFDLGVQWYESLFDDAPQDSKAIGEMSHDYLYSEKAAERIDRILKNVRLICCVRHPIERAVSHWNFYYQSGWNTSPFSRAIKENPEIIDHSIYSVHVKRYIERFGRDRIEVLLFDDLTHDPRAYAARIFDFLSLERCDNINYEEKIGASSVARNLAFGRLAGGLARMMRRASMFSLLGTLKRQSKLVNLIYRKDDSATVPKLGDGVINELKEYFEPDICTLEGVLDRDLAHWREYRD